MYTCDGPYALCAFLDFCQLIGDLCDGSFGWDGVALYAYSLTIYIAYLGSNIQFLRAMKMENQGRVRGAILANVCFVIALIVLIIYSKATNDSCDQLNGDGNCRDSDVSVFTSGMRFAFVIFMGMAVVQYCRMWDIYKHQAEDVENGGKSPTARASKYVTDVMHMGDEDMARISTQCADADGDNKITREEYESRHGTSKGNAVRLGFDEMDKDGDGVIDEHELKAPHKLKITSILLGIWPVLLFAGMTVTLAWVKPSAMWDALA